MDPYTYLFLTRVLPVSAGLILVVLTLWGLWKSMRREYALASLWISWIAWVLLLGFLLCAGAILWGWLELMIWTSASLISLIAAWYIARASLNDIGPAMSDAPKYFFSILIALVPYVALNGIIIHILIVNTSLFSFG